MIRPEFRKILMDQRGAAVILWSFFVISIPVYIVIARSLLGNPNLGSNRAIAEPARIIFWLLTLVDLGYYTYWKKRNMSVPAILQSAKATKLFRAWRNSRAITKNAPPSWFRPTSRAKSSSSPSSKRSRCTALSWLFSAASCPINICFRL